MTSKMTLGLQIFFRSLLVYCPLICFAQETKDSFELYGYINTDGGYNFNSIDPDWFDVMRPTKLPKYKNEFGPPGNYFISVRQTRFGVRSFTNTKAGVLKTQFDFDLFGFGKDAGQTTIHLVNGFGELGKFLGGQTPSTIMDTEVFPVTLDYWGPCSRIFFLNVQLRYTPVNTSRQRFAVALERPGATADGTDYSNSVNIAHVRPHLPLPNFASYYRHSFTWGYARIAAILKYIGWKDTSATSAHDLSGSDIGWGVNISSVINASKKLKFKLQGEKGDGFQNYTADPSPDVALQTNTGNTLIPVKGKALPLWGFFSFAEVRWNEKLQSSIGFSLMQVTNSDLQAPDAFRTGRYGLINVRYYPLDMVMMGLEYQYGKRENFRDGFSSSCNKIQFSFRFNFSQKFERK